ncbi:MAG: hypothetical protein IPN90_07245 [Elusimicrobia bacterium]|nr:hypothetical protein [Elusimicrobiota bacterium]
MLTGCATIFGKSGPQSINIESDPSQAKVVIVSTKKNEKVFEGSTPAMVKLEKKEGYFSGRRYEVTISKPGFQDSVVFISPKLGGWYLAGNFVFGGLIGWLIVDPATGAMWNLSPKKINESLGPKQAAGTRLSPDEIRVVLLQQVPENLKSLMVPITR